MAAGFSKQLKELESVLDDYEFESALEIVESFKEK